MNEARKCMIVDDEPAAHYVLMNYISKVQHLELVKQCYNGIEALNYLHEHTVDLMFLDIDMPEITGLELLKALKHPPRTILCTAYSEFALESYDYGVIDYLLKPVFFPRFLTSVERFFSMYQPASADAQEPEEATAITLKIVGENVTIPFADLLYIQSFGNYVKLHTARKYFLATITTAELEASLPPARFARIHKSYIVALDKITGYEKDSVLVAGIKMPVGITYRQQLAAKMRR